MKRYAWLSWLGVPVAVAAWMLLFEGFDRPGEVATIAFRQRRMKHIGLAWKIQQEKYEIFPADDVRSMMQTHGYKDWTHAGTAPIYTRFCDAERTIRKTAFLFLVSLLGTVAYAMHRGRFAWYQWLIVGVSAALVLLCLFPGWVWLFAPPKGYDYVDDFTYIRGVRADADGEVIVAHDRIDLVPESQRIVVLRVAGYSDTMSKHELKEKLEAKKKEQGQGGGR
jgi:hypothetical protein